MIRNALSIIFTFAVAITFAQTYNVSGNVTAADDNFPIPGVNVIIKNTARGVSTDFDGNYTFDDVPSGATLVFSYVGFQTKEVVITSDQVLNIQLETDVATLDEVVVIGYGTQTKKEITGAVGIVSSETIEELKPTRVEQALQGQVAGVQINSNSGSPGSGSTISIRGISTNGDSRPLILVDGNVVEDLSVINPNDIESVNVLKDATAGIYGVRAANGVILIKTKTGRRNQELSFEYSGYAGFQETTRKIPTLNATEYALIVNESFAASGQSAIFPDVSGLGIGTDWQEEVFENALIVDNSITIKGGKEKSTYSFGSSFLTQDGIVGGNKSNFSRFTKRINYGLDILENIKLNASLLYTHTNRLTFNEGGIGSVLFNALNMDPTVGRYGRAVGHQGIGLGGEVINPVSQIATTFNRGKVDKVSGTAGLSYNFLDKFTVQSNIQVNWARAKQFVFSPIADFANEGNSDTVFDREVSEVFFAENYFRDYTFDAFVKYENIFKDVHNLKLLLGTSIFQTTGEFSGQRGFNIPDNSVENATLDQATNVENIYQGLGRNPTFDSRLLSYFTRVQYDYKGTYLLSAVLRRDGSTKFGPENKFGYFPSGSIGWIASNESFLEESNTINFLKFRASYGILGNDRIPDFRYVSLLNGEGTYVLDNTLVFGTALGAVANPEIRWEKQKTFDVGVDLKLFDNKLDITADYFKRETEDLLVVPEVSGLLGTAAPGSGPPVVNAGSVENKGIEFSIGYNDTIGEDFKFNIRYNVTAIDNEVLSVSGDDDFLSGGAFGIGQEPPARMEAGFPIGYFRGYMTDGIFQNQSELDSYPTINNAVQAGDLRFVDLNNDGLINDDDKTYLGDPIPDATMGLNIRFDYKNFDLGAYAYASLGNEIVRNYERNQQLTNRTVHILDRWTGEGTSNTVPRVTNGANSNNLFSDYFVEDGSFVRIQNVQLGYTFSDKALEDSGLDKLRIYISSNNVYTFTEYRGYDPTASSGIPIGGGIDPGFYPSARTFILGVNLKF
jgi:TonB-linked SusC/RagA family outer membrane protein